MRSSRFSPLCGLLLLYGVTPLLGGDGLGLVGADEPRYAQIAHEMLDRFDHAHSLKGRLSACVTPYLYGRPWLEKPALYYWRAMFVFQEFGVHDWSARLPSATFAFIMVALIYLHMRRFRPGGHLDAALITVACAGIIAFARGASTDMQMAAPLAIGLLGWYAWYETDSKFWLFDIYFFTGVATLAKGPVAPFLAIVIVACICVPAPRVGGSSPVAVVAGRAALLCHRAALVFGRAAPEPDILPRILLRAQSAAVRHRPLRARPARLVLPGGDSAGDHAVDGDRRAGADRRHPDFGGGVAHSPRRQKDAARQPPRRRVSRISGAVGADPHRVLYVLAVQASRLHPAFDSAHHHSYRRLPLPAAQAGAQPLGVAGPCGAGWSDDHVRAAAAVVCGPWRALAADACAGGRGAGRRGRGAADS